MTVNDHSVDIRHWQIFQIAGGIVYIDLGMPVNPLPRMQNSPSELLTFFRFPKFYPSFSQLGRKRVKSVGDATSNRWLWRKATRLKWRRQQQYGYHCSMMCCFSWEISAPSLGDVFSEKNFHEVETSTTKSGFELAPLHQNQGCKQIIKVWIHKKVWLKIAKKTRIHTVYK